MVECSACNLGSSHCFIWGFRRNSPYYFILCARRTVLMSVAGAVAEVLSSAYRAAAAGRARDALAARPLHSIAARERVTRAGRATRAGDACVCCESRSAPARQRSLGEWRAGRVWRSGGRRSATARTSSTAPRALSLDTLPMKISAELLSTGGGTQVLSTKPP